MVPILSDMHPVQDFSPYFPKIHSNIISSYRLLGLRSCLFPSSFPIKVLYAFSMFHACYMLSSCHFSSLCSLLQPSATFSQMFSSAPCSQTLNLFSSLNTWDIVSHPYKTAGNITVRYILIFKFLESRRNVKDYETNRGKHLRINCTLSLFVNEVLISCCRPKIFER
jgi:hypothetical protein